DGGVSGVSLSVVSSANDKNGEIAGNGGIWSDDGSLDGSDSVSEGYSNLTYKGGSVKFRESGGWMNTKEKKQ
nr:hypothetical protein [Tanacetum cinerariifolium]